MVVKSKPFINSYAITTAMQWLNSFALGYTENEMKALLMQNAKSVEMRQLVKTATALILMQKKHNSLLETFNQIKVKLLDFNRIVSAMDAGSPLAESLQSQLEVLLSNYHELLDKLEQLDAEYIMAKDDFMQQVKTALDARKLKTEEISENICDLLSEKVTEFDKNSLQTAIANQLTKQVAHVSS
ncbi:MAG: hypothetical protein AAGG80_04860 [Pseudomonadota bacterium]